jgi:hypothetical protein
MSVQIVKEPTHQKRIKISHGKIEEEIMPNRWDSLKKNLKATNMKYRIEMKDDEGFPMEQFNKISMLMDIDYTPREALDAITSLGFPVVVYPITDDNIIILSHPHDW